MRLALLLWGSAMGFWHGWEAGHRQEDVGTWLPWQGGKQHMAGGLKLDDL